MGEDENDEKGRVGVGKDARESLVQGEKMRQVQEEKQRGRD